MAYLKAMKYYIALMFVISCFITSGNMLSIDYSALPPSTDYCMGTPLKAKCKENEVVVMVNATYGRMRLNKCVTKRMGYLGCSTNVLRISDSYCSGKQYCEMMVPNDDIDKQMQLKSNRDAESCYAELRLYLEASYVCVGVRRPSERTCHTPMTIPVSSTGGIISSQVTASSASNTPLLGCGPNPTYPWTLDAQKGQILNISMTDFGWKSDFIPVAYCSDAYSYGYILDLSKDNNKVLICGGKQRTRHLYTSKGPSVQIVIFDEDKAKKDGFLIHYEAIGCPDLIPPRHAWMSRDGDKAVIGCMHDNLSRQTWHLTCNGHQWSGVIGNCTQHVEAAKQAALLARSNFNISHGIAICIIIGLALFISLVIIIVGVIFFKRYKKLNIRQNTRIYHPDRQIYEEPKYKTHAPVYDLTPSNPTNNKGDGTIAGGKRNEYTHIWEYPLPEPISTNVTPTHTGTGNYDLSREQTGNNNNQINLVGHEQYGGSMDSKSTAADCLSRYYALDQTPMDMNNIFNNSSLT